MYLFTFEEYLRCAKIMQMYQLNEESAEYILDAEEEKTHQYKDKIFKEILSNKKEFLKFIKEQVCECLECPIIISKQKGLSVLKIHINAMKNYIKAKDQSIIAKNYLLNIGKRYAYMPAIKEIIKKFFKEDEQYKAKKYSKSKMNKLIQQLEQNTNYDKGIAMEKLAKYFLETIPRNTCSRK